MASTSQTRLEGNVALITGAASGIGESTARLFSRHRAKVVIADIQDQLARDICKDLGPPSSATFVHCDVTEESNVETAVYGKLDIIEGSDRVKILGCQLSDFKRVNLVKHAARVSGAGASSRQQARPLPCLHQFEGLHENGIRGIFSNLKGVSLMPEDVAEAFLYLGSDESKYVGGHNLMVDGRISIMNQACNIFDFINS